MSTKNSKASKPKTASPQRSVVVTKTEAFKGPLPHPALFKAYEDVLPGSADRIIAMAEKEQAQLHAMQHKVVDANVSAERRGMLFGFIFQIFVLIGIYGIAALLLLNDKDIAGFITLITALAGTGVFFYGATNNKPADAQPVKKET